ncbi:phosphoinositide phospholipase C 4-like [Wolffia australiana]
MGSYKMCLCFSRKFRAVEGEVPPDVKEAFATYADGGTGISPEQLRRFLVEVQGEAGATVEEAERIVDQVRHHGRRHHIGKASKSLSLEDFQFFLLCSELNAPTKPQVHQDMTAPLSHYFIYTGHNSYLTGNQLSSDCSDVPIIRALERGVRVIELDIWPNSKKDDINVLHGRTLTSPVELIKCLKSIKEYAFVASPYPVIITLEDHLTPDLQAKVAQMVSETFGDMLYYPESGSLEEFPSPEALKNRIILSTKPPKEYLESKISKDDENGSMKESKRRPDEEAWGKEVPDAKTELEYEDEDEEQDEDEDEDEDKTASPEYRRLITIAAGKPKGTLKDALKVDPDKVRRLSLSEQELVKATLSHGKDVMRFTQRNILRVYPKGTRFNSSNYNPFVGWMHGAQMVAFNMQGYGRSLWLMHGFYKANGGCGFIKKPDFLMANHDGEVFDPSETQAVQKTLKVKVCMGDGWHLDFKKTHFDAFSPPDFYARVGIAGAAADSGMKKTKTKEDCWSPMWNEEFEFPLTVPELAVLRVEVHEYDMSEKDDFAGQCCLPVSELRPGYRSVQLSDRKGNPLKSVRLLLRFQFS